MYEDDLPPRPPTRLGEPTAKDGAYDAIVSGFSQPGSAAYEYRIRGESPSPRFGVPPGRLIRGSYAENYREGSSGAGLNESLDSQNRTINRLVNEEQISQAMLAGLGDTRRGLGEASCLALRSAAVFMQDKKRRQGMTRLEELGLTYLIIDVQQEIRRRCLPGSLRPKPAQKAPQPLAVAEPEEITDSDQLHHTQPPRPPLHWLVGQATSAAALGAATLAPRTPPSPPPLPWYRRFPFTAIPRGYHVRQ